MPILKRQVDSSPNFASLFSSSNIYFDQKEPIKMKFFDTWSARAKIRQIPHVNFEMTSQFLFKFSAKREG